MLDPGPRLAERRRREGVEEIRQHFWFHSIDLGRGVVTPGLKTLSTMVVEFGQTFDTLDLRGASVLDVGAWNGGFSAEAKRRGASRVAALDHYAWNFPRFRGRETFDLVNRTLGLGLEAFDIDLDAPQLSLAHLGQFDVVLFLGVFYHLRDPLHALREVAALAAKVLVVETHIEEGTDPRPSMIFYPGSELDNDPTNWWGPNRACVVSLLKTAGFARVETTASPELGKIGRSRAVVHAFRD
jgi:tRNA (mo5U34)-methyltransferase